MDGFDLAAERKRRGVTQEDLATAASMSKFKLSGIENNDPPVTEEYLQKLLVLVRKIAAKNGKASAA